MMAQKSSRGRCHCLDRQLRHLRRGHGAQRFLRNGLNTRVERQEDIGALLRGIFAQDAINSALCIAPQRRVLQVSRADTRP